MSEAEPLYPNIHHSRLPSGASSISSSSSDSPVSRTCTHISPFRHSTIHIMRIVAVYPSFDLYPLPPFNSDGLDSNFDNSSLSPNCSVGLLQPSSPFIHHGYAVKFFPIVYLLSHPEGFIFFFFFLLANSGQTVHKSLNLGSPVPPVSTVIARCGATAKAAAQSLW